MQKLIRVTDVEGFYTHWCPGCEGDHGINTKHPNANGAIWKFDGNFEKPTFTPSVNIHDSDGEGACHYNITEGMIIYASCRNHALGGTTVPLIEEPELPNEHH